MRKFKHLTKKIFRFIFELFQYVGIIVLPNHFYSQIPSIKNLKSETYWRDANSMFGINGADLTNQLDFIKGCISKELSIEIPKKQICLTAVKENAVDEGYGIIEADLLYAFVRTYKPKKIIQIGCGVSTSIILRACKDENYNAEIICVEPFPTSFLKRAAESNKIKLLCDFILMI